MSQLFPINLNSLSQPNHIERYESMKNASPDVKNTSSMFRPIISKILSKRVLSSMNDDSSSISDPNSNHLLNNGEQQDYSSIHRSLS